MKALLNPVQVVFNFELVGAKKVVMADIVKTCFLQDFHPRWVWLWSIGQSMNPLEAYPGLQCNQYLAGSCCDDSDELFSQRAQLRCKCHGDDLSLIACIEAKNDLTWLSQ